MDRCWSALRTGRGNASMLGAGNSIIEQLLEVDSQHADAARALLAAVEPAAKGAEAETETSATPAEAAPVRKQAFVATGLSLLWPGLGIAYVGYYFTGFVVAVWSFAALTRTASAPDPVALALFGHLLPRVLDLFGSQFCLRHFGRSRVSMLRQAALALVVVGLSAGSQRIWGDLVTQLLASFRPAVPAEGWPFNESAMVAAVCDTHVTEDGAPILLVVHLADDNSWAFLSGETVDPSKGALIAMQTALTLDPTLRSIADLPPGWTATREAVGRPWLRAVDRDE